MLTIGLQNGHPSCGTIRQVNQVIFIELNLLSARVISQRLKSKNSNFLSIDNRFGQGLVTKYQLAYQVCLK